MKIKIKVFALLLVCFTTLGASLITVQASSPKGSLDWIAKAPDGWNASSAARLLYGTGEADKISVFASIFVSVNSPCDKEWRNKYPNDWMYQANRAIEDADELMLTKFSIDLRSKSQVAWNPPVKNYGNGSLLLKEAYNTQGLNGAQLMVAFTGKSFPYGGWGYVGGRGTLIIDQGYPANASVVRHEIGHNYGCPDHYNRPNPPVCFMNDAYGQYNSICTSCYNTWYANRNSK